MNTTYPVYPKAVASANSGFTKLINDVETGPNRGNLPAMIASLAAETETLAKSVNALADKIRPVTNPEPPQPAGDCGGCEKDCPLPGVLDPMRNIARQLTFIRRQIDSLNDNSML
jgi:hypothetical protein